MEKWVKKDTNAVRIENLNLRQTTIEMEKFPHLIDI